MSEGYKLRPMNGAELRAVLQTFAHDPEPVRFRAITQPGERQPEIELRLTSKLLLERLDNLGIDGDGDTLMLDLTVGEYAIVGFQFNHLNPPLVLSIDRTAASRVRSIREN